MRESQKKIVTKPNYNDLDKHMPRDLAMVLRNKLSAKEVQALIAVLAKKK